MTDEEKKRLSPYAVDEDTLYRRFVSDRPSYAGTYEQPLSDVYQRITNRPRFEYDATKDPLYQQHKDQYIQGGKLAMRDTLGQAAALTGGYGSSYGQQVGQQAYDAYLKYLSAVVPELYSAAYGRYQDEGDALRQQYAMLGQQRDTEYSWYLDELGAWQTERAYQTQLESTEYSRQQDEYSKLYSLILGIGYQPSQEELAAAGMRPDVYSALYAEYQRQHPAPAAAAPVYYGGGGSSGSSKKETDTGASAYTFEDVARAYDNAEKSGNSKDAKLILKYAVGNATTNQGGTTRAFSAEDRKYILKNRQVKDRI